MGSQAFKKDVAKRGNLWQFDPKDMVIIGHDTKDGPEHELYDERIKLPLDESMILSIMAIGVRESVTIRKNAANGTAEVVNGRRRVLHAREANKRLKKKGEPIVSVPAILETGSEEHMNEVSIALNEIRVDDPMMVKVAKCERLLARNGGDRPAAARAFGVTTAAIKNWMKIAELAPKVRKAIDRGDISPSAAATLHGKEKEEQVAALDKLIATAPVGKKGKGKGKKKKPTAKAAKAAAGKRPAPGRRVLMKLIEDEELSAKLDPGMIHGIRLALGEHLPEADSRLGKLLAKAGYTY